MLIDRGYLTPPTFEVAEQEYDTSGLQTNSMGKFTSASVDAAFLGRERLTHEIVQQVVAASQMRRGVMFFAATIAHAHEIMRSLPDDQCRIVTGETSKKERDEILRDFKSMRFRFIVNVDVLTTGFDAPHVDVIAILRATESVSLLQQIIGRGLRTCAGKADCLVMDFAGNIERHCPDGDVFTPTIRTKKAGSGEPIEARCPTCKSTNQFAANGKALDMGSPDEEGYIVDLAGSRLMTPHGPMPAHFGRRCNGHSIVAGQLVRCLYRWTFKTCPSCAKDNDISARYCSACKAELVDPNEKLKREFDRAKSNPEKIQCDTVISWEASPHVSARGNECLRILVRTPYRRFTTYVMPGTRLYQQVTDAVPRTVTYRKRDDFYNIIAINHPPDDLYQ
jgi:DNA repair protein RadD